MSKVNINLNGKNINVKIPAGTIDGQTLRLKGLGKPSINGGLPGDVLITLNVNNHPYFSRDDKNILLDVPITLKEAILGAKITVPTISGKVAVNIPAYASSGEKLRLRGKGVNGGDQIMTLKVIMPKSKNTDLEDVLKNMDDDIVRTF
jgi:DnaJ-class molecular chaperone